MVDKSLIKKKHFVFRLSLLLIIICSASSISAKGAFRNVEVGQQGSNFVMEGIDGNTHDLISDGAAGNLFIFWRSGQSRSERAMADLQQVWTELSGKEINIIGIAGGEDKEELKKAAEKLGLTFPVVIDPGRKVYGTYGAFTVPSLGILDKDGKLVYFQANHDQKFRERIKGELEILLGAVSRDELEAELASKEPQLTDGQKKAIRYESLGRKLLEQDKSDRALSYFQKAYEADAENKKLLVEISTLLIKMEKWDEAGEAIAVLEPEFPRNSRVFLNKAVVELHKKNHEGARAALEYALVRNPRLAEGYFYLGQIEEAAGNMEAALKAYRRAFSLLLPDAKGIAE